MSRDSPTTCSPTSACLFALHFAPGSGGGGGIGAVAVVYRCAKSSANIRWRHDAGGGRDIRRKSRSLRRRLRHCCRHRDVTAARALSRPPTTLGRSECRHQRLSVDAFSCGRTHGNRANRLVTVHCAVQDYRSTPVGSLSVGVSGSEWLLTRLRVARAPPTDVYIAPPPADPA